MKLELGKIYIKDVQFADRTYVENGTLYVCKEEIEKIVLEDERLIAATVELARPGESVRISPVKDVIEPRIKVDGPGGIFPGIMNKVQQVGEGRTHALVGSTVITCGKIVGFQEGVIDMSGPTAKYTPFSETCDKVTTYHHLNNPVIEDLYKRHGKDLNFVGVILTNENVFLADKERHSDMVAKLAKYIGLDGLLITEEGYGNPDTDLMMNCKKVTQAGVKTVIITDEFPGRDGKSYSLADAVPEADTMVSCGQGNLIVHFPPMDKLIGTMDYVESQIGGYAGCMNEDGSFDAELQIIIASTIANGFNKLAARTY